MKTKEETFVEHIKKHLKDESLNFGSNAEVICTICRKTIDQIYEEEKSQ